jgi:hypothetical protein
MPEGIDWAAIDEMERELTATLRALFKKYRETYAKGITAIDTGVNPLEQ